MTVSEEKIADTDSYISRRKFRRKPSSFFPLSLYNALLSSRNEREREKEEATLLT